MKKLAITLAVIAVLFGSGYGLYRYNYPFGMYHRCNKVLWFELQDYAQGHGGAFPSGEKTPEASLSLIHTLDPSDDQNAHLLCRRDVSVDVVREMLRRGQLLGPDTCGWNYVEGLRLDSNRKLALFWDKEGLDEMGGTLRQGGHFVGFIDSPYELISASEWDSFLEEQHQLLAEEKAKTRKSDQPPR